MPTECSAQSFDFGTVEDREINWEKDTSCRSSTKRTGRTAMKTIYTVVCPTIFIFSVSPSSLTPANKLVGDYQPSNHAARSW
jgi:hypothetical protein